LNLRLFLFSASSREPAYKLFGKLFLAPNISNNGKRQRHTNYSSIIIEKSLIKKLEETEKTYRLANTPPKTITVTRRAMEYFMFKSLPRETKMSSTKETTSMHENHSIVAPKALPSNK
jgi:hypothetical protein